MSMHNDDFLDAMLVEHNKRANKEKDMINIAEIINNRVGTNLGQIHGTKSGYGKCADITTTVDTTLVAEAIIEAGYGDTKQAKIAVLEELKTVFDMSYYGSTQKAVFKEIDRLLAELKGE